MPIFDRLRSIDRICALVALATLAYALAAGAVQAADFAWIEAETPTSAPPAELGYEAKAWGNASIMSGGKVLQLSVPEGEGEKKLGKDGAVFSYDFTLDGAGKHQAWARIGFEWVRSDFDWRIDSGEWKTLKPSEPTCDLQLIQDWNELAWIMLGEQELTAGKHSLQIRHLPQTRQDKDKTVPARNLHISDCFCISKGPFRPNGRFKPGEDHQAEPDKAAAAKVFEVALGAKPEERASLELSGAWQFARWDEATVKEEERLQPAEALPQELDALPWFGIELPGDRDHRRPEFSMAHRYIYRTRVKIPAEAKGRGFFLDFQNFSMVATVFVNGQRCGWSKACSTSWQCDITPAVKAGEINALAVVFKDCYYAIQDTKDDTRHFFNLPHGFLGNQGVSMKFDMPICWDTRTGILDPVSLVVAGAAYASDVFAKPSVKRKELGLEVTLRNPSAAEITAMVENEAGAMTSGAAPEKTFKPQSVTIPAHGEKTIAIAEPFEKPRLWWPSDPQLYTVTTKVSIGGKPVDVRQTRFGFREWEWDSSMFKLNGVKWQLRADIEYGASPQAFVESARKTGQNMMRYWFAAGWAGMNRRQVLDYFDEQGMCVRNSGIFDGEGANYGLVVNDGGRNVARKPLFDNWIEQLKAWVRTERNHPSVFVWSIENEITYINSCNLGLADIVEPEIQRGADEVMAIDPTRPAMEDGGRALKKGTMPINGCHYNDGIRAFREYPDAAYDTAYWYQHIEREHWPMVPNRPVFHGECFFANGYTPAQFADLDGDRCYIGMSETAHAQGLYGKMLSEGWRWSGVAAFQFWAGHADGSVFNAWQPVCVLCREWNWTFGGGSEITRTLKVLNDTNAAGAIEMGWALTVGGKPVAGKKQTFDVPAGETHDVAISFNIPKVSERTPGELVLTCSRDGKEVFREIKKLIVIDADAGPKPKFAKGELVVIDPAGTVKARLKKRGIDFVEAASAEAVPASAKVVVVGPDAISEALSTDPLWYAMAVRGVRLLVLDQASPLHFQATPADFEVSNLSGRIAFSEDLGHPAFAGLEQCDFFTWSKDHVVYRNAYRKATRGARSLVQCDSELNYSALVECQVADSVMLLSQLVVGQKLDFDPVAQRVFDNLLAYAASYQAVRKGTAVVADASTPKGKLLKSLGIQSEERKDPLAAISGTEGIAVIDATPANLKTLAGALDKVKAFTAKGGWLMLWGVTPEGLADYNRIVGFEHVIRPFQLERVVFSALRDPLTSGLTLRDVVMDSGEQMNSWAGLCWPDETAFSHILDYDDIAPFAKLPTPEQLGKPAGASVPRFDHWPANMVNGFTADDTWRLCYSILLDRGDKTKWTMELPHEEELTNFSIVLNVIYHKVTTINLYFDEDPTPFTIHTRPTHDRQDFSVAGKKARKITIELAEWEKSGTGNVIGVDNLWLGVKRPEAFLKNVKPLLNIGGLMRYSMGKGGVVLNQLNILEKEQKPINAEKKANITKVLLKNLGAVFQGGQPVVVGSSLAYAPLSFGEGRYNAYITKEHAPAWFASDRDLGHIPAGDNKFAGVTYRLLDFKTSPVPSCVMLQGPGSATTQKEVTGIPVGATCDALFFLHAFNATDAAKHWKQDRNHPNPPALFTYVVHYKDGSAVSVPVVWKEGVAHWRDKEPKALSGAAIGWSAPFPGDASGEQATVYSMQWDNPTPGVAIESIDLRYAEGGAQYGTPVLLAITAATVQNPAKKPSAAK